MKLLSRSDRVFALDLHADYQCRHSGACCTAGWTIPIEAAEHRRVSDALSDGRLTLPGETRPARLIDPGRAFVMAEKSPEGAAAGLRVGLDGACVFFDRQSGNLCAIQRDLGHASLPAACRQFPRVALTDRRGTFVTLSHYCPTAAAMLFREDASLTPVADPPMCAGRALESFDATDTVPPLLRPGVLFDLDAFDRWERFVLRTLGDPDSSAEQSLASLSASAERIRSWRAGDVTLASLVNRESERTCAAKVAAEHDLDLDGRLFTAIAATVPEGLPRPALPEHLHETCARFVDPVWSRFARPIRYFLAAHAFGAWMSYQGDGVRTFVRSLAGVLAVLRIESIRRAARAARMLDKDLLISAIRAADLLLVHLASREILARHMSRIEAGAVP